MREETEPTDQSWSMSVQQAVVLPDVFAAQQAIPADPPAPPE